MKKLLTVEDYMATKLLTLKANDTIYHTIGFLLKHKISGAPVVDDNNKLIGIISEKDCLKLIAKGGSYNLHEVQVVDYMTKKVDTISPEMDVYYAAGKFLKHPYRRLPVVEGGKLVGQISRRDVLRAIKENIKPVK